MTADERFPGMDPAQTYRLEARVSLDEAIKAWGNKDEEEFTRLALAALDAETRAEEFDLNSPTADPEEAIGAIIKFMQNDPRGVEIPLREEGETASEYLAKLMLELQKHPYPESGEQ